MLSDGQKKFLAWKDHERNKLTVLAKWNEIDGTYRTLREMITSELYAAKADDSIIEPVFDSYRAKINAALPERIEFPEGGYCFIGPNRLNFSEVDGYPLTEVGRVDIKAIVDGVDFWAIVEECEAVLQ